MTNKQFPLEFREAWALDSVKAAFVLDEPGILPERDCVNCGGRGFMSTFVASKGPFNNVGNLGEVSHYHDGKWWVGKTITATCPVCHGLNNKPVLVEETPAQKASRPKAIADVLERKDWA